MSTNAQHVAFLEHAGRHCNVVIRAAGELAQIWAAQGFDELAEAERAAVLAAQDALPEIRAELARLRPLDPGAPYEEPCT
jgi:hypothetical protein